MHMLRKKYVHLAMVLVMASGCSSAFAGGGHGDHMAPQGGASVQPAAALVEGEVRKVDKEGGRITLRHGELKHLNMQAMSMVFRVREPAWLDQVRPGDKVRFFADRVNGQLSILELQVLP